MINDDVNDDDSNHTSNIDSESYIEVVDTRDDDDDKKYKLY